MATKALFGLAPEAKINGYRVKHEGSILSVTAPTGKIIGRITLGSSQENRGTVWLGNSITGEFTYDSGKYYLRPIRNGLAASRVVSANPVKYIIQLYKKTR